MALSSETPQADSAAFRPEPRCPVTLSSHPEMGGLLGPSWFHVVVSAAWRRALDVFSSATEELTFSCYFAFIHMYVARCGWWLHAGQYTLNTVVLSLTRRGPASSRISNIVFMVPTYV